MQELKKSKGITAGGATHGAQAKALNRVEFTMMLVHLAIAKYIMSDEMSDVSEVQA